MRGEEGPIRIVEAFLALEGPIDDCTTDDESARVDE